MLNTTNKLLTFRLASLVAILLACSYLFLGSQASAATTISIPNGNSEYNDVCAALKKISGQKLSTANCRLWATQSDQDSAVKKICDKYGANKLKSECNAYDQAISQASSGSGSTSNTDEAIKCEHTNCDLIKKYVNPLINMLTVIFAIIAVISLILGGINYSTSEGDPQKVARAKSRIFNTILAVVAYMFLFAFIEFLIPGGVFTK
jgi:hypothetical protein